jgi:DUF917 family protein
MRSFAEADLEDLAIGAAILGTGGGGNPYVGKLLAREAIRRHGPVAVVDPEELPDDALVVPSAMIGAPTVIVEKLPSGEEALAAFEALQARLGRRITHTMPIEAGGLNSTMPFTVAAKLGIPVVDADGMGRAFPEVQMVTATIYGIPATPMALADEKGNQVLLEHTVDNRWTERLARSITVDMGSTALVAQYPMTGAQVKDAMIPGTLRLATELGERVRAARERHEDPVAAIVDRLGGRRLFTGKIVDVERRTVAGFTRGEARIEGLFEHAGEAMALEFQNEFLIARRDDAILASVPDLITVVDLETGEPITTEDLRYGFRIAVLGAPCDARWRTAAGLEIVGPRAFGYEFEYVTLEDRSSSPAPAGKSVSIEAERSDA